MADKTLTIKNASDKELDALLIRLRKEYELQGLVSDIERRSMKKEEIPVDNYGRQDYYAPISVSTEVPIESLYHGKQNEKTDDVLKHFGIGGMKWGVRKASSKPSSAVGGKQVKSDKPDKSSADYKESRQIKAKGYKNMSTKELADLTKRLQLEKQLRDLKVADYSRGIEPAKAILAAGTTIASLYALSTTPMGQAIKKALIKS